jgi:hypothetical protein
MLQVPAALALSVPVPWCVIRDVMWMQSPGQAQAKIQVSVLKCEYLQVSALENNDSDDPSGSNPALVEL